MMIYIIYIYEFNNYDIICITIVLHYTLVLNMGVQTLKMAEFCRNKWQ